MSGSDVRVIEQTLQSADVTGLAEHAVKDLPIATVAAVLNSSRGNIIGIFHQYAHLGTGKTIHSANQMRHFGIEISDAPLTMAGKQRIHHPDGYIIPLSIRNGLPYIDMHPPTDHELHTYPHVFFTSDDAWNPQNLDHEYNIDDLDITDDDHIPSFGNEDVNDYGEFNTRECSTHLISHHQDNFETYHSYVDRWGQQFETLT